MAENMTSFLAPMWRKTFAFPTVKEDCLSPPAKILNDIHQMFIIAGRTFSGSRSRQHVIAVNRQ